MKVTPQKLKWFVELQGTIEEAAVEVRKILGTFPEFEAYDINEIDVNLGRREIEISGDVHHRSCTDYFTIVIPFEYFEDPVKWQDEEEERQHQAQLDKIAARIERKEQKEIAVEKGERRLLAELKEKYGE